MSANDKLFKFAKNVSKKYDSNLGDAKPAPTDLLSDSEKKLFKSILNTRDRLVSSLAACTGEKVICSSEDTLELLPKMKKSEARAIVQKICKCLDNETLSSLCKDFLSSR